MKNSKSNLSFCGAVSILVHLAIFSKLCLLLNSGNQCLFFQPLCSDIWWDDKNPYNLEQNCLTQICSGGWVNTTGTNLTGIMETMKYAYHSVSTEDLESLKEMISRANFTYTIHSTTNVILSCFRINKVPYM